jgi:hypothetical protein
MKLIQVRLNIATGTAKVLSNTTLYEGEQYTARISVGFEGGQLIPTDQLYIEFVNKSGETVTYNLTKDDSGKHFADLPREILERGKLKYTIVKYNDTFKQLQKWYPEPLFITIAGDIGIDSLNKRPDVFADINARLKALEDKIK